MTSLYASKSRSSRRPAGRCRGCPMKRRKIWRGSCPLSGTPRRVAGEWCRHYGRDLAARGAGRAGGPACFRAPSSRELACLIDAKRLRLRWWHGRVGATGGSVARQSLADEIVSHAFSHGYLPDHTSGRPTGPRHWADLRPTEATATRCRRSGPHSGNGPTRRWTVGPLLVSIRR